MRDFFYMDGYWAYIWSAWGVSLIVLVGWWLIARQRHRAAIQAVMQAPERAARSRISVTDVTET